MSSTENAASRSVECPSCGATLRNVVVASGAKVRCLNCGARFLPPPPGNQPGTPSTEGNAIAKAVLIADALKPVREPGSPGYWLLRIPVLIALPVGTLAMIFSGREAFRHFQQSRYMAEQLWSVSYLPLLAWVPLALTMLTGALAAIDRALVKRAWRAKLLVEPLPPPPGSSLPYIAPLAVCGGALPILLLRLFGPDDGSVLVGGIIGAVLFYAGFALEDVRQFCWRMEQLGRLAEKAAQVPPVKNPREFSGALLGGALLLAALCFLIQCLGHRDSYYSYYRSQEFTLQLYFCLALFGLAVPALLLGRSWDRAVARWRNAARPKSETLPRSAVSHWLCAVPLVWSGAGLLWIFAMCCKEGLHGNTRDNITFILAICAGLLAAWWIGFVLSEVFDLRAAWSRQGRAPRKLVYPAWISWLGCGLAGLELTLMAYFMWAEVLSNNWAEWRAFTGIPLALVMLHYPTLWLAVIVGNFQKAAAALKQVPEENPEDGVNPAEPSPADAEQSESADASPHGKNAVASHETETT